MVAAQPPKRTNETLPKSRRTPDRQSSTRSRRAKPRTEDSGTSNTGTDQPTASPEISAEAGRQGIGESDGMAAAVVSGEGLTRSCDICQHGELRDNAEGLFVVCKLGQFAGMVVADSIVTRGMAFKCQQFEDWQIGDRVRILKAPRYVGSLGTIRDMDPDGRMKRLEVMPDGGMFVMDLLSSELEFVSRGEVESNNSQIAETHPASESQADDTPTEPEPSHITHPSFIDQLATDINRLHSECEQALTIAQSAQASALEHAKEAGLLLLQAKQVCGHGGWEKWREANLQLPSSTATLYQRIADRWDELQESGVATVKGAMDYLKKARIKSATDSQTVAEMKPIVHEKDLTTTLQAAQADFHQRKAAAESRAADSGSSIPKPLQQGDTLTTAEDGQKGKVLAIANDGKVAIEWGNGHTGLYTPKEVEEYGYRRAEPRIGAVVTGYDSSTGMATFNFVQMPEQPTQEEVDEANWGHLTSNPQTPSPKPQALILGLSEVHYAVRKFAALNERQWDEQMCDEVAAAVLDFLAEY